MKKLILKSALIIFVSATLLSCSKDDDGPNYQEENFLEGYLSSTDFNQKVTDYINSGSYEFGLEFTPLVNGVITSIRVELPDTNPSLKVTIWDKETGTVLKTEIVNVASANTVYNFDIVDLALTKDKEYTITMNSNDWYKREKTDGINATYPITVGNIQINNYKWGSGNLQVYPGNTSSNYFAGDISFNFKQTE